MSKTRKLRSPSASASEKDASASQPVKIRINAIKLPGNVGYPKFLAFQVREQCRRIFLNRFFAGRAPENAWAEVAGILRRGPKTVGRWIGDRVDPRTKLVTRPPMDELCEYTVAANLEKDITYPSGRVIGNRAIAATLMEICKQLPKYKKLEIDEIKVRFIRFYVENLRELGPLSIKEIDAGMSKNKALEDRLRKEFDFAYLKGGTTGKIVAKMHELYKAWAEPWETMTSGLGDETWLYAENETDDDND